MITAAAALTPVRGTSQASAHAGMSARPMSVAARSGRRYSGPGPLRYVALGDSYSSGEANPPFMASKGGCDLSRRHAWPELLAAGLPGRVWLLADLACAGAATGALERPFRGQPAQIPAMAALRPNLVTITIGGNDVGFARLVANCVLHTLFSSCVSDRAVAQTAARISRLRPALVSAYRSIKASSMPGAEILVVGYPQIFPPGTQGWRGCLWLASSEQVGLNRLVREFDAIAANAARLAGVGYVSTKDVFAGHELCTPNSWLWTVGFPPFRFDAHPTLAGQRAMAERIRAVIASTAHVG